MATLAVKNDAVTEVAQLLIDTVGTDEVCTTKITLGAAGVDGGFVSSANPLPISDASGSLTVDNATLSVTGGGVEASAMRVTIASDSTGVLSVDDNGGSLTVDGTVAVSGTVAVTDNSGSLTVDNGGTFVVQENGAALTSLQLLDDVVITDDAAFTPATTKVLMVGATFDDSTPDSVNEGDAGAVRMSANRNLYTTIRDAAGNERGLNIDASGRITEANSLAISGGVATIAGWNSFDRCAVSPILAQQGVTGGSGVVDAATQRVVLATDVALPAGTNAIGKLAANSGVDIGDVDVTSVTPGTGASSLGKAEDAAHSSGDVGVMSLTVRQDTAAALGGTDADYQPLITDASGRLHVNVGNTVTVGSHAVTNAGTFAVQVDGTALTRLTDIETNTDSGAVVGNGAAATAQRVTLANDGTGVLATVTNVATIGTSVTPGTSAAHLGKAEDAAHASGDTGVMALAVRSNTAASTSGTDGDYQPLITNTTGHLWVDASGQTLTVSGAIADDAAFTVGTSKVQPSGFLCDESSTDSVDEGDAGAARITPDRKQIVTTLPHTAGGLTMSKTISAASTNATSVKASAGMLYGIQVFNVNAAVRYLKLYNKASAPTVGSDTPVKVIAIPGATTGGGDILNQPMGLEFTSGIAFALTTGLADADTGAVAATELVVNLDYK